MAEEDADNKEVDTSKMSAEEINELQKQNCVFCKIAQKQIPAKILHEDDKVLCILDINPASEGHILVYPKEHYMILPHIPEPLLQHLFKVVKLMSNTLLKSMQCKGTSIFIANGMAGGQKAPHVLIHVFPRKDGDGLLELPKYDMSDDQVNNLKKLMGPYMNQIFGGNGMTMARVPLSSQVRSVGSPPRRPDNNNHNNNNNNNNNRINMSSESEDEDDSESDVSTNDDDNSDDSSDEDTNIENKKKSSTKKNTKKVIPKKPTQKTVEDNKPTKNVSLDDISKLFGA